MKPAYLIGLIGSGIQASLTPKMHMKEAEVLGLRHFYQLIDLAELGLTAEALPDLLVAAERMGFSGLTSRIHASSRCFHYCMRYPPTPARLAQLTPWFWRTASGSGKQDSSGFASAFARELPDVRRKRVIQFGAGGAGSAVATAALASGVESLLLMDNDTTRAADLADRLCARYGTGRARICDDLIDAVASADGLINATPVGMTGYPGQAVPASVLRPEQWVADIVYFPLETALLASARARGCRVLSGGGMAVYQAVEAFRLFTGRLPSAERMLSHFHQMTATPECRAS